MGYHIDLSKITLDVFEERLSTQYLLPSQKILKNDLNSNFMAIKKVDLFTMADLQNAIKSKIKISQLSETTGIPIDYLTILRREINSYLPKFRKLDEFSDIDEASIKFLNLIKIKNTYQLFQYILTKKDRENLSRDTSIPYDEIMMLTKYTDLSRIKWVGPVFAKVLIVSGYDTVDKVSKADFLELYNKIAIVNKDKKYYRGQFGINDAKLLVIVAKDVPKDIEY